MVQFELSFTGADYQILLASKYILDKNLMEKALHEGSMCACGIGLSTWQTNLLFTFTIDYHYLLYCREVDHDYSVHVD